MNRNLHVFTKEEFEALCEKQRDYKGRGKEGDRSGGVRSPSQIIEMSWNPKHEQNEELANEVNEWVEFLPYGYTTGKSGGQAGKSKENSALKLCKWILTTRSQDETGQWSYVDRPATMEEVLSFKERGWPWYR